MSNPSTRKNRLTYSLRGLFIAITIIAAASAAVWTAALPARLEHMAAQALVASAQLEPGAVERLAPVIPAKAECATESRPPAEKPSVEIEYQGSRGIDSFLCWVAGSPGHVQQIVIREGDFAPQFFFENAAKFKWLQKASIDCDRITAHDVEAIARCRELAELTIECHTMHGSELRPLAALPELTQLTVKSDSLDCGVFAAMGECRGLWSLEIEGPRGLESTMSQSPFGRFRELRLVMLQMSGDFPEVVLEHVADLRELTFLTIHSGALTDSGVAFLASNQSIQVLFIHCENITDASIGTLINMKALRQFSFDFRCGITAEGLKRLEAARPDIRW